MSIEIINKLGQVLNEAAPKFDKLDRYYTGTQPLAFLPEEVRTATGGRLFSLAINWPRLVVSAVEERLDVEGFRLGRDEPADAGLWRIWQANNCDETSQLGHAEALILSRAYAIVWAGEDPATPRITVESARQVYVQRHPGTRRATAALKRWTEDGYGRATVYEPDKVTRWRSLARVPEGDGVPDPTHVPAGGWTLLETIKNPLGIVPVVPLVNRPRLLGGDGESELADVLPLSDAINKLAIDMMVSSEFHAMPRRWATGIEIVEDEDGEATEPFSKVAGREWIAEDPETKFGQFPEATLSGFIEAIGMFTKHIAALSGLPPHYLLLGGNQPASADAIRSAEASLVAKARRRMRAYGGSWEDVMRLAVLVRDGRPAAGMEALETIWRDPETRTVAQAADAAVKKKDIGVPFAQLAEDLGYTPTQVQRMRGQRRADALDAAAVDFDGLIDEAS